MPTHGTDLYRMFDADGRLLYVGITDRGPRRWREHMASQPWWSEVAVTRLEHFSDRSVAEAAEREAIQAEKPTYNVVHATREQRGRSTPEFRRWLKRQVDRQDRVGDLARDATDPSCGCLRKGDLLRHMKDAHGASDAAVDAFHAALAEFESLETRVEPDKDRPRRGLVGQFVHTPSDDEDAGPMEWGWQGEITARVGRLVYQVTWYSALDGYETYKTLVHVDRMEGWRFYASHEAWREAGERGRVQLAYRRQREQREAS